MLRVAVGALTGVAALALLTRPWWEPRLEEALSARWPAVAVPVAAGAWHDAGGPAEPRFPAPAPVVPPAVAAPAAPVPAPALVGPMLPAAPAEAQPLVIPADAEVELPVPAAASAVTEDPPAEARRVLMSFLQARNWRERVVWCEEGDRLREELEAYDRRIGDGAHVPLSVEHIASAPLPDGLRTVQVFQVAFPDLPQGFPVPVRQTSRGWRLDGRTFIEFRESRLKRFLDDFRESPAVFRVRLRWLPPGDPDGFDPDASFPEHRFRIAAPIQGHEGIIYADKNDPVVGPKIADRLNPQATHLVMVRLQWARGITGRARVELRDIVSESWREEP